MSEEMLVRCCAPTLAGLKTGSLFSCPYDGRERLREELRSLNRRLSGSGLQLLALRCSAKSALLYLFRPEALAQDLKRGCAREILAEAGYADARPGACVRCLIRRLCAGGSFPHEVGLFLSYPPEDVRGFIENRAQNCKLVGDWKVYGDEESARRTFEKYRKCTETYCRSFQAGLPLEQLAVAITDKKGNTA